MEGSPPTAEATAAGVEVGDSTQSVETALEQELAALKEQAVQRKRPGGDSQAFHALDTGCKVDQRSPSLPFPSLPSFPLPPKRLVSPLRFCPFSV